MGFKNLISLYYCIWNEILWQVFVSFSIIVSSLLQLFAQSFLNGELLCQRHLFCNLLNDKVLFLKFDTGLTWISTSFMQIQAWVCSHLVPMVSYSLPLCHSFLTFQLQQGSVYLAYPSQTNLLFMLLGFRYIKVSFQFTGSWKYHLNLSYIWFHFLLSSFFFKWCSYYCLPGKDP